MNLARTLLAFVLILAVAAFAGEDDWRTRYSAADTTGWTEEQVGQRLALVDQLLATTTNQAALELLQRPRSELSTWKKPAAK